MSEENINYPEVTVQKGATYTAERAITIKIDVKGRRRFAFDNNWDYSVPFAQEWRDLSKKEIDFSDITLDSSQEDIVAKRESILAGYPVPTAEEFNQAISKYEEQQHLFDSHSMIEQGADLLYGAIDSYVDERNFDKFKKNAGELFDAYIKDIREDNPDFKNSRAVIDNQEEKRGLFGIFKKAEQDPLEMLKSTETFNLRDYHRPHKEKMIQFLEALKDAIPQTYEDVLEIKKQIEKRGMTLYKDFMEKNKFRDSREEKSSAEMELKRCAMQVGMHQKIKELFNEQLQGHIENLKDEKLKNHIAERKDVLKNRIEAHKGHENEINGVVMADTLAEVIKENQRHNQTLKTIGALPQEHQTKMMTPDEAKKIAQVIQSNRNQRI